MRAARRIRQFLIALCVLPVGVLPVTADAGVIGAQQYLEAVDRQATLDRIDAVLAREQIADELRRLGVAPEDALARAESLNDRELLLLADELEELPAGAGLLGTIGIVFVVLLILELVGVIDIFNKI